MIPCYRESRRLPPYLEALATALGAPEPPTSFAATILIVDDGSGEPEADALNAEVEKVRTRHPNLVRPLLRLPRNIGKGGTVYSGWDHLAGNHEILAFVDADGAVDAAETLRFLALAADDLSTAWFASRLDRRISRRSPLRRLLGWGFRALQSALLRLPIRDTQCGLKAIPASAYRLIRSRLSRTDFLFDIDLALRLTEAGCPVRAEPVRWIEKPGSHLRAAHLLSMAAGLAELTLSQKRRSS